MPERPPVLLAEDDVELAELLRELLEQEGYAVTVAPDGQRALHLGLTRQFAVLLLDRGLPGVEGVQLLAALRRSGVLTPALILSARGSLADRVEGLDAGAEDYLTKPFEVAELLARLRALLRRHSATARALSLGRRVLDLDSRTVRDLDRPEDPPVNLSEREVALLAVLAARPNRVFSRAELLTRVFVDAEAEVVVDTYVHYCRKKLGRNVVRTVRGIGYQLGRL
ncbi:MAG: response regulator transcription factor [Mycobacteriales bacterium]